MDIIFWTSLVLVGLFIYFVPTMLANENNHSKLKSILILNICLGWTVIGWICAIIWACTEENESVVGEENEPNRKGR